eukprot:GHVO01069037.1.p1 GENE.GHVO01069037.1~~GHVO01069037.1.p1  ORF type:complete len:100 (+),score=18.74 GHVO01069037.1:40-339(+)
MPDSLYGMMHRMPSFSSEQSTDACYFCDHEGGDCGYHMLWCNELPPSLVASRSQLIAKYNWKYLRLCTSSINMKSKDGVDDVLNWMKEVWKARCNRLAQ